MNTYGLDTSTISLGEISKNKYDTVILPWGSIEPHNHHLPYLTDTILAYEIAKNSANTAFEKTGTRCMVLPPIYLGSQNPGQWDLPFCIHTNIETQKAVLNDIVLSLRKQGITKMVLLNGHGGNNFKPILRDLSFLYPDFLIVLCEWFTVVNPKDYFEAEIDEHAGETETSVMMYYRPELVHLELAGKGQSLPSKLKTINDKTGWIPRHWKEVTEDTGIGNPQKATAEKGEKYIMQVVNKIANLLAEITEN